MANQKATDLELQLLGTQEQIGKLNEEHFDVRLDMRGKIAGMRLSLPSNNFTHLLSLIRRKRFKTSIVDAKIWETCKVVQLFLVIRKSKNSTRKERGD